MTREIEFRAWDSLDRKMIYDITQTKQFSNIDGGYDIIGFDSYLDDGSDTVIMQYTGFKDKNGKKIYEGDVVYICGLGNYQVKDIRADYDTLLNASVENDIGEIIGDIYQNPELLKEKKND